VIVRQERRPCTKKLTLRKHPGGDTDLFEGRDPSSEHRHLSDTTSQKAECPVISVDEVVGPLELSDLHHRGQEGNCETNCRESWSPLTVVDLLNEMCHHTKVQVGRKYCEDVALLVELNREWNSPLRCRKRESRKRGQIVPIDVSYSLNGPLSENRLLETTNAGQGLRARLPSPRQSIARRSGSFEAR